MIWEDGWGPQDQFDEDQHAADTQPEQNEAVGNTYNQYEDQYQYDRDPNYSHKQNYSQQEQQTYNQQEQYVDQYVDQPPQQEQTYDQQDTKYEQEKPYEQEPVQYEQEAPAQFEQTQLQESFQEAPQTAVEQENTPAQYQQNEPTELENFSSKALAQASAPAQRTDLPPLDFTSIPIPFPHRVPPPSDALRLYAGNYTATFKFLPSCLPTEEFEPLEFANEQQKQPETYQQTFEEQQYQDGSYPSPSGYENPPYQEVEYEQATPEQETAQTQNQPQAHAWREAPNKQQPPHSIPSQKPPVPAQQESRPEQSPVQQETQQSAEPPKNFPSAMNPQEPEAEEEIKEITETKKPASNPWLSKGKNLKKTLRATDKKPVSKRDPARRRGAGQPSRTPTRGQTSSDKKRASPVKRKQKKPLTKEQLEKRAESLKLLTAFEMKLPTPPKGQLLRGLPNAGVHCYVNSLVQALVATPKFRNYFATLPAEVSEGLGQFSHSMAKFVNGFASNAFKGVRTGSGTASFDLIAPLVQEFEATSGDGQQDVSEFYQFLINQLHNELIYTRTSPQKKESRTITPPEEGSEWVKVGPKRELTTTVSTPTKKERSFMESVFGGVLRSVLGTSGKRVKSDKYEPFFSIQVSVSDKVNSIDDALRTYLAKESMLLSKQTRGGRKTKAAGSKRLEFSSLPSCLVIELKRWVSNSTGQFVKDNKSISFNHTLQIGRRYLISNDQANQYALRSVIVHKGEGVNRGHYLSYIWVSEQMGWTLVDDDKITQISWAEVQKQDPYMLFYEQMKY